VRQVINPAGSVTLAQGYDPFGNPLTSAGSGGSVFGYTGEQVDASTGLVYLRARYYQPATGRFLMPDPWPGELLDPRSLPPSYIYASGNPANRIDPSGQGGIHSEVELRYAVEYDLEVEYTIPTTVPPNMPSWARWGWRIDLISFANHEIYEVELTNVGAPYMTGHGPAQVQRYLNELNHAYAGVGIAYWNDWRPGRRVRDIRFLTWDSFAEVHAWWNVPGVILFEAHWTQKALDAVAVICLTLSGLRLMRQIPQGRPLQPQPATLPPWLSPDLFPPMPTPIND
jgi:RHS repeat-associated protein